MLLETGFDYENGVAVQTRTARQTVEIQDGKIVALRENKQAASGRHAAAL